MPLEREQRRALRRQHAQAGMALAPGATIDGKRLAGARGENGRCVQLLSATTHRSAIVVAQRHIDAKTTRSPNSNRSPAQA